MGKSNNQVQVVQEVDVRLLARERNIDHYIAGTPVKVTEDAYAVGTVNVDSHQNTGDFGYYFRFGDKFASVGQSRKAGEWMVNGFETIHEAMLYTNEALGFEVPRRAVLPSVVV